MTIKIEKVRRLQTQDLHGRDDELELFLECTLQYKSTCEFEGISWESKIAKYEKRKNIILFVIDILWKKVESQKTDVMG